MDVKKMGAPESVVVPRKFGRNDKITFRCHPGVSCFTACCRSIRINLTPYDIYRLVKRLGVSYDEFLREYTEPRSIDGTPLPIPSIKLRDDEERTCPFVTPEGCTVYTDRPATCRYYPVGMAIMKHYEKPVGEDFFILIKEDHCKGHEEDRVWTIGEWREDQGSDRYDEINQDWMEVVLKAKSLGMVEFGKRSLDLFFMVSSNLDMFRKFVVESDFLKTYRIDDATRDRILGDDMELLRFSLRWLRWVMFGEGDFQVSEEAQARAAARRKRQAEARKKELKEREARAAAELERERKRRAEMRGKT